MKADDYCGTQFLAAAVIRWGVNDRDWYFINIKNRRFRFWCEVLNIDPQSIIRKAADKFGEDGPKI